MNESISLNSKEKLGINGQLLYEIAFIFYFSDFFLQFTTFMSYFGKSTCHLASYLALGLVIFKIFFLDDQNIRSFVLNLIFLGILVLTWRTSSDFMLFSMGIFVLGARNVDFRRIIYLYFVVGTIILLFVMLCSFSGLIQNLVYRRNQTSGAIRRSFGIVYPTDFAAHVLFLILAFSYLRFDKITAKSYIAFAIIALLLIRYCDARLSAVSILLLIPIMMIGRRAKKSDGICRKIAVFFWCVPILLAYCIIAMSYFYRPSNRVLEKLNHMLSGRLAIGNEAIRQYGFSIFGRHMVEHSWGGVNGMKMFMGDRSKYFFVDSSFLRILILYGVIAFIIILAILTIISYRSIKYEEYALATILVIVAISAVVEQRLIDVSYDPFLIALLANVYSNKRTTDRRKPQ